MDAATDDLHDLNLNAADDEEYDAQVLLAFLEDPDDPEELQRHRFPNKAGGAPAWLDPVALPTGDSRLCGFCREPLRFALRVYAPLPPVEEEDEDAAYHRTLFVFMCPAMACLLLDQHEQVAEVSGAGGPRPRRRSVRVFRCQLPRENAFYCYVDDGPDGVARFAAAGVEVAPLCEWCGTWRAETACAGCAASAAAAAPRMFCSENHLERHVRTDHGNSGAPSASATWPEYAMSTAAQKHVGDGSGDVDQENAAGDVDQENAAGDDDEAAAAAVDDALMGAFEAAVADEDTARWETFLARVSTEPEQDQVLRYCAGGRPLWAAATGSLTGAAPACGRCGAARRYEMQVMPQLLDYLRVEVRDPDPLDWATVAVYTCANSCGAGGGGGYVEEFAWVQLHSPAAAMAPRPWMTVASDSCSGLDAMHEMESSDDES